jgi:pimeloyl-ACP methyl ester carboxylesterase
MRQYFAWSSRYRHDANRWLSARIFGLAQRAQTDLIQVARYLTEEPLREKIQARVEELLDKNTDLIIAHSLGSIVGWEACHRYKGALPMLLTIGSPLGLDSIVYPRLRPSPPTFPPVVHRWVNIAHPDDIIAVEPRLEHLFPSSDNRKVEDHMPTSQRNHHAAEVYLEQTETGKVISDALTPSL